MNKLKLIIFSILTVLIISCGISYGFKANKDTAKDRQDKSWGTGNMGQSNIKIDSAPGQDTYIGVHPTPKQDDDQKVDIGPIIVTPRVGGYDGEVVKE